MTPREKMELLRKQMSKHGFDALIVFRTDPAVNFGFPGHWEHLMWLAGFSGSAGTLVVTAGFAGLWTDSRYTLQAGVELKGSGISLFPSENQSLSCIQWLEKNLSPGSVLALDENLTPLNIAVKIREALQDKDIKIEYTKSLTGSIREDSPAPSLKPVLDYSTFFTGETRREKFEKVRKKMGESGVDFQILSALDDIAWIFNLRGSDLPFSPLFEGIALISRYHEVLFVEEIKLPGEVKAALMKDGVSIKPPEKIAKDLSGLPANSRILINPAKTGLWLSRMIPSHCRIVEGKTIPAMMKTRKNDTEVSHIRNVMVKEGAALVKFFMWIEKNRGSKGITEYSAARQLDRFRNTQENYTGMSFPPIVAFGENGAKVHYTPVAGRSSPIGREGILLVDSGGQYLEGTTDTTRTVCLGSPSKQQKQDFTQVLKGHIELAATVFPEGTRGFQLDPLARKHLWQDGKNYGHGTGHGVGFFLNVHEGPPSISSNTKNDTPLEEGMILSNEPGIYREGEYGIRTENLVLVTYHSKTGWGRFLTFETLTLFPVDIELIDVSMLSSAEKEWLNNYHMKVWNSLSKVLSRREKEWLKEKTRKVK